jgi:hypothetical protein
MLTWHQANSLPFIAKAMLNRLFKNLSNQVTRALTHCWARWNAGRPYTARVGTRLAHYSQRLPNKAKNQESFRRDEKLWVS